MLRLLLSGPTRDQIGPICPSRRNRGAGLKLPNTVGNRAFVPMASSEAHQQHGHDIEEPPAYCIPADGIRCQGCRWDEGRRKCFSMECDALFTPRSLRERQKGWRREGPPQLVITAGPERSGSTWLYNAVRLLFKHGEQPLDAYWLTHISDRALDMRGAGQPGAHHVLIKTHEWSTDWDLGRATHVFITHRDLRQVVQSYRRLGWASDLPRRYVEDHMRWRERAELDIAFEDIVGRPNALLEDLAGQLGLLSKVDVVSVAQALNSLPVPTDFVDSASQMWPSHLSQQYMEGRSRGEPQRHVGMAQGSRGGKMDYLKQQYPDFFSLYGYD